MTNPFTGVGYFQLVAHKIEKSCYFIKTHINSNEPYGSGHIQSHVIRVAK